MKVHNYLPLFSECMRRWKSLPSFEDFSEQYYSELGPFTEIAFDGLGFYQELSELNWPHYRERTLRLDPKRELARLEKQLDAVQDLFQLPMQGEIILFGAFEMMDGYARFEKGAHRVFIGVDESFEKEAYLDVLMAHELTHVVRESRPEVWEGFGLNPKMTHDEFTENLPVIEHLFSEGFSCAVSELLVSTKEPWHYAYQEKVHLDYILKHPHAVDERVHTEIFKDRALKSGRRPGDYSSLYWTSDYQPPMPQYSHYYWAWQWVKQLLEDRAGGDPRKLISVCSEEWVDHALRFRLQKD